MHVFKSALKNFHCVAQRVSLVRQRSKWKRERELEAQMKMFHSFLSRNYYLCFTLNISTRSFSSIIKNKIKREKGQRFLTNSCTPLTLDVTQAINLINFFLWTLRNCTRAKFMYRFINGKTSPLRIFKRSKYVNITLNR